MTATENDAVLPPGPSGRAALGTTLAMQRDMRGTLSRLRAQYGDVVGVQLPRLPGLPRLIVHVSDPAVAREVLTDTRRVVKGPPVYRELAEALGDGLLTSEGERWRGQRRTLQPLFTRQRIEAAARCSGRTRPTKSRRSWRRPTRCRP